MNELTVEQVETSFITFAETILGFDLYPWQCAAVEPFDEAGAKLVQLTLATPNGSGKSAVVIPTLGLGWLALFPKGRVVITTADGKQLDGQVMPAIEAHRGKFEGWTFIEREIRTNTGGRLVAFTTDDAGRAEGWHKLDDVDGPLLIIADEAKTIPEEIFTAIDRCTFNALLLTSSPGHMSGRFYESQTSEKLGFIRLRVGLKDCPHISADKIERLEAQYGPDGATPNAEFLRSTLHGEFMAAAGKARFNEAGLKRLKDMAAAQDKLDARDPLKAAVGWLEEGKGLQAPIVWTKDDAGPFWIVEGPRAGCSYIGFCDPTTGKQAEGSTTRDGCSAGIMRIGYTDGQGIEHPDEPVAFLHGHNYSPVHWDNDIVAESLDILLRYYGDCPINVEANNSGGEIMTPLLQAGRVVCRRKRRDHKNPGKLTEIVGFQTTDASKRELVGAVIKAIREQSANVQYSPMTAQLSTFILDENGKGEAQAGCHDDHVVGLGLALLGKHWAQMYSPVAREAFTDQLPGVQHYGREPQGVGGAWS